MVHVYIYIYIYGIDVGCGKAELWLSPCLMCCDSILSRHPGEFMVTL